MNLKRNNARHNVVVYDSIITDEGLRDRTTTNRRLTSDKSVVRCIRVVTTPRARPDG